MTTLISRLLQCRVLPFDLGSQTCDSHCAHWRWTSAYDLPNQHGPQARCTSIMSGRTSSQPKMIMAAAKDDSKDTNSAGRLVHPLTDALSKRHRSLPTSPNVIHFPFRCTTPIVHCPPLDPHLALIPRILCRPITRHAMSSSSSTILVRSQNSTAQHPALFQSFDLRTYSDGDPSGPSGEANDGHHTGYKFA